MLSNKDAENHDKGSSQSALGKWLTLLPSELWHDFVAYQYKRNKAQLLSIMPVGILFYIFYYFPTQKFAPDISHIDFYVRLVLLGLFLITTYFAFFKKKNLEIIDILINSFSVIACAIWLYLLDSSKIFNTPSFIISSSVFIFTCCATNKTRFTYAATSAALIFFMTIWVMLRHDNEILSILYQSIFLYIPIVLFALVFCWQNLNLARKQFLRQVKHTQEKEILQRHNKQLSHQAYTDKLTGIRNRRCFEYDFKHLLQHIPAELQLAVIVIDLDFFKPYNDNYGHLKGDECLIKVAHNIRHFLREKTNKKTKIYRVGGEEFFIIHQYNNDSSTNKNIEILTQGMIDKISSLNIEHLYRVDHINHITISIGCCMFNHHIHKKLNDMIYQADKNLYKAKQQGKNQAYIS